MPTVTLSALGRFRMAVQEGASLDIWGWNEASLPETRERPRIRVRWSWFLEKGAASGSTADVKFINASEEESHQVLMSFASLVDNVLFFLCSRRSYK